MSATLPIELDRTGSEPLYRQIESFVRGAIDGGRLRPGQRMPSVRALAGQLGVGRLTYRKQVDLTSAKVGNFFANPTQAGPTWNVVDWYVAE